VRPELTREQASYFSRGEVLRYTGLAGADQDDPWDPQPIDIASIKPDLVVGRDCTTIQEAVNLAVETGKDRRLTIGVLPGIYVGLVYVPKATFPITLVGLGETPNQTLLAENIDAEMPGDEYTARFKGQFAGSPAPALEIFKRIAKRDKITTANASVLRVENDGFQLVNLTIRNTYNADRIQGTDGARNSIGQFTTGQHQAVALLVAGADRVQIQNVALKSFQDTLYLQSPAKGETVRTFLSECSIEGDVDFIFGQSTAWFERCRIRSLGSRAAQSWVTAPSTDIRTRYGFVFNDCDFLHDSSYGALAGRLSLGRQWFEAVRATPYGVAPIDGYRCDIGPVSSYDPPTGTISLDTLNSVGKCVIMHSRIHAHINAQAPWEDWSGTEWNPRHRPVQFSAAEMFMLLGPWLEAQGIGFEDVDPDMVFLGEYQNEWIGRPAT